MPGRRIQNSKNPYPSSLYKVAERYFAALAQEPFELDGIPYTPPDELIITYRAWRRYTCPPNCGACCHRYELVFIPEEFSRFQKVYPQVAADTFKETGVKVTVNGETVARKIYHDPQDDISSVKCRHLNPENGRCGIHVQNPFHCAIELLRFTRRRGEGSDVVYIGTQKFGRGWNMEKIDGTRGAMCEILTPSAERIAEVESHIHYTIKWMDYFGIPVIPSLRDFKFQPRMLKLNVVASYKRPHSLKFTRALPAENEKLPVVTEPELVQLRSARDFVRFEEDRVYSTERPPTPSELPKIGVFRQF